ncbi:hypothetical protein AVEN_49947-1 [Araneus ventricosus]|uniref:Uncharacterized protein n=1 Tax=Araneus ventricosus TaxID=182803 RepID=A0A4Y2EES5_ARAVE|nr:hypothetical protein AVEN_49947-1 [Araneus ventricosus]
MEPPEGVLKEEYEEWMFIDVGIPVAATLTDLETCKAVCEQDQRINVDDSDGDECVLRKPSTYAKMRQGHNILSLQHRSTCFENEYKY